MRPSPKLLLALLSVLSATLLPAVGAAAEIGDPCDDANLCPAGWFCFPEGDTGYCTTACPEAGCPEGFSCRNGGGPRLFCLKGEGLPPGGEMGAACDGPDACAEPLTCFADNDERYCSRYCTVPGSCPEGFRCQQGASPACSRVVGAPAGLEPCAAGVCAAGWDCITHPSRTLPLCAFPCPEGVCDGGLACVDGHCLPNPWPATPKFGEKCVLDGLEAKVVGCEGEGFCLPAGPDSYCTSACDIDKPCPAGYGCRSIETGRGECRRGVPNDDYYNPMMFPDGAFPDPPDTLPPPMQAIEQDGGGGGSKSDGCAATPGARPAPFAALGVAGVLLLAFRRRRARTAR
jgi:MYXO-CTERM domain-containing protein